MIYYDMRTHEWTKDLDTDWLAPELYYEITVSLDEKQYHSFMTRDGIVTFSSVDNADFEKQYNKIESKVIYRKSWALPKEYYERGLKYFGIKED